MKGLHVFVVLCLTLFYGCQSYVSQNHTPIIGQELTILRDSFLYKGTIPMDNVGALTAMVKNPNEHIGVLLQEHTKDRQSRWIKTYGVSNGKEVALPSEDNSHQTESFLEIPKGTKVIISDVFVENIMGSKYLYAKGYVYPSKAKPILFYCFLGWPKEKSRAPWENESVPLSEYQLRAGY